MADHSATQHDKSTLHKWFGPNRSTHWTIAGSVAVILLGGYLVYSNREGTPAPAPAAPLSAAAPTPAPMAPVPLTSGK